MTARTGAKLALALGLLIALVANLSYAVPRGLVVVGLGLIAPLVLPVVLHLRTTFTADGFWAKTIREASTLAVAGPAVAISYVHTMELVLAAGEPWLLAVLAPLSSDGLAGLATLALYQAQRKKQNGGKLGGKPKPQDRPRPVTPPEPVADPTPAPAAPALPSGDDELRVLARRLLADGRAKHGRANFGRGRLVSAMRGEGHQVSQDWCRQVIAEADASSPIKLVEAAG
jgi:hypothetical protein